MSEIRNCEFRYKCPKLWESLDLTGNDAVRLCGQCNKTVHYCKTPLQLHAAIVANQCVAVEIQESVDSESRMMFGDPLGPPYIVEEE